MNNYLTLAIVIVLLVLQRGLLARLHSRFAIWILPILVLGFSTYQKISSHSSSHFVLWLVLTLVLAVVLLLMGATQRDEYAKSKTDKYEKKTFLDKD